jgi:hypothetical protein
MIRRVLRHQGAATAIAASLFLGGPASASAITADQLAEALERALTLSH